MEYECAIISLIYITRLVTLSNGSFVLNEDTWRGALLACMLVSSKVWDDFAMFNADYCCIFNGLTLSRVNELELQLLRLLMSDLYVSASQFAITHFKVQELVTKEEIRRVTERATTNKMGAQWDGRMQRKVGLSRANSASKSPKSCERKKSGEQRGLLYGDSYEEEGVTRNISLADGDELGIKVSDSTVASYSNVDFGSKRYIGDSNSTIDRLAVCAELGKVDEVSVGRPNSDPVSESNSPVNEMLERQENKQMDISTPFTHPAILHAPDTPPSQTNVKMPMGSSGGNGDKVSTSKKNSKVVLPSISPKFAPLEACEVASERLTSGSRLLSREGSYSPSRDNHMLSLGSQVDDIPLSREQEELWDSQPVMQIFCAASEKSASSLGDANSAHSASVASPDDENHKMGVVEPQEIEHSTTGDCCLPWLFCFGWSRGSKNKTETSRHNDAGSTPVKRRKSGSKQKVIPVNSSVFSPTTLLRRNWEERNRAKLELAKRNQVKVEEEI